MKAISFLLVLIVICALTISNEFDSIWISRWALLLVALCVSIFATRRADIPFIMLAIYVSTSGVLHSFWAGMHPDLPTPMKDALRLSASQTTIAFLITVLFFIQLSQDAARSVCKAIGFLGQFMGLLAIFHYCRTGETWRLPIFHNPTMTASFVAVSLPLALMHLRVAKPAYIFAIVNAATCCLIYKAVAPLGCLAIVISTIYRRNSLALIAMSAFAVIGLSTFDLGDTGRYQRWADVMRGFDPAGNRMEMIFGMGAGSLQLYFPLWDKSPEPWLFLHNDWLQIFVEQGLIGICLSVLCVVLLVLKNLTKTYILAALLSFSFLMLINPPLHWPLHALLGASIFFYAMKNDRMYHIGAEEIDGLASNSYLSKRS